MAGQSLLTTIPLLQYSNVFIKNYVEAERKLLTIIQGGVNKLQIITDFDETITKQKLSNGESLLTSIGLLHACPSLPDSYKIVSKTLYAQYHPYEIDETLDKKTKANIMLKWWKEESNILKNFRLPQNEFENCAQNSFHKIRDSTFDMLKYAKDYNIPVLIFSAGVGNGIISILKANGMMFQNISIASNFLKYKEGSDVINGFQGPLIHILNKNECLLEKSNLYPVFKERSNILLLGDAIGDAEMAIDAPNRTVLRLGFIKQNDKFTIDLFSNQFDILLFDDQSMNVPFYLLKIIQKI